MSRKSLSDAGVARLKPAAKPYAKPDPETRGHYVRVYPTGSKSFWVVARLPDGKQKWEKVGDVGELAVTAARDRARPMLQRLRAGLPAVEPSALTTYRAVAGNFMKRHVTASGLRSAREIQRILDRYILPAWGDREFTSIRRADTTALLDGIEDASGAPQADAVLAVIRRLSNWYSVRVDDYVPPVVRGMRRSGPYSRKRSRVLGDDEIRKLWAAADTSGNFGALLKIALLTGQRRSKIAAMQWADLSDGGVWTIPGEAREKGNAGELRLPPLALAVLRERPQLGSYVFCGRADVPFSSFPACKLRFDDKAGIAEPWVVHDLRRTARSLMARVGVAERVGEQVLGHVIGGVEGVYNLHRYADEKADALQRLADLIGRILDPQPNVILLKPAAAP